MEMQAIGMHIMRVGSVSWSELVRILHDSPIYFITSTHGERNKGMILRIPS